METPDPRFDEIGKTLSRGLGGAEDPQLYATLSVIHPPVCPRCGMNQKAKYTARIDSNGNKTMATAWTCNSRLLVAQGGEEDFRQSKVCSLRAELAAKTKRADEAERKLREHEADKYYGLCEKWMNEAAAAASRAEALENGIRTFLTQYEELRSHGYIASISHLPANCKWSEATKKERAIWGGLAALLPQAKEAAVESEVCPKCGSKGKLEEGANYWQCGSHDRRGFFDQSDLCESRESLAEKDARIAALTKELQTLKNGIATYRKVRGECFTRHWFYGHDDKMSPEAREARAWQKILDLLKEPT